MVFMASFFELKEYCEVSKRSLYLAWLLRCADRAGSSNAAARAKHHSKRGLQAGI